jgi:two-component system response regulator AtoC
MMEQQFNILVADDDGDVLASCMKLFMRDMPFARVSYVQSLSECLECVQREQFNVILLDITFANTARTGLTVLPEIKTAQPNAKIFMMSGVDDELTVLQSMELGAVDFISKRHNEVPNIAKLVKSYIEGETKRHADVEEGKRIAANMGAVFSSRLMEEVFARIAIARRHKSTPVLITGETGVGKDVVATAIALGPSDKPPVTIDCGAIPETLAESEFFGHTRGSFTGADSNKIGKFQLANGADLFLDEIGNLKRGIQEKLLRVLQSKEITQVGGTRSQKINVRIIAATNENLEAMVIEGRFRQDLLERLKGIWIEIPPLRDRPEDIQPIAESIIAKSGKPHLAIAPTCMSILKSYSWRGNVRELENVVKEMIAEAHSGPITVRHLPEHFRARLNSELRLTQANAVATRSPGRYDIPLTGSLEDAKAVFIRQYISDRFERLGRQASRRLLAKDIQIARSTLDSYLGKLELELGKDCE